MNNLSKANKYGILVFLVCLSILVLTIFGEKSDLFNGVGSDGLFISHFTPDLINNLKNKSVFTEGGTRLLPVFIAHLMYCFVTFFRKDQITNFSIGSFEMGISENIVLTFEILNVIYLSLAVIIFAIILYKRDFSFRKFLLSISFLTLNFMFLKQSFFEPVFIDQFYLLFSVLLLFSVQFKIKWLQYVLLFFAFFVSTLSVALCVLLLFNSPTSNFKIRLPRALPVASISILYLLISYYLVKHPICTENYENSTIYSLLNLSIVLSIGFFLLMSFTMIPVNFSVGISKNIGLYLFFILGIIAYKFVMFKFTHLQGVEICEGLTMNVKNFVINNIRQANSRPLGHLSSHFNYFGLLIIFIIFYGRLIKSFLRDNEKYVPLILFFIFAMFTSESRYLVSFIPFVLIILFYNSDRESNYLQFWLSNKGLFIVIAINIVLSEFYLKINPLSTDIYLNIISDNVYSKEIFSDQMQKYFRHLGPWTSNKSYIWQLGVFIITLSTMSIFKTYKSRLEDV